MYHSMLCKAAAVFLIFAFAGSGTVFGQPARKM